MPSQGFGDNGYGNLHHDIMTHYLRLSSSSTIVRVRTRVAAMPLPLVSPSATSAPKYSGQQHSGARRSFWDSESDRYWEKCRKNKRSTTKLVILVVIAVLILAALVRRKSDSTGGTTRATMEEATTNGLQIAKRACVASAMKHELESIACAKACARARTAAPRPLAHRSCLAGCRAGVDTAWDKGCSGGHLQECIKPAVGNCDEHCASYRNQFPKPTIFNHCQRSCFDVVDSACLQAAEVFVGMIDEGSSGIRSFGGNEL